MTKEKIAIIVDSGSDVSESLINDLDIYRLPLGIIINDTVYTDGVDITSHEVYEALKSQKVSTSLPSGEIIEREISNLKEKGYTHIIAVVISSGLSGTYNVIRLLSESITDIKIQVIDTLNISLGSGFIALEAARLVKDGKSFVEVINYINNNVTKSKVFFTVGTLDYLIKGGRIGQVVGTVANVFNIKPIISCNEEGIYHTVSKTRGYKSSINKMIDLAAKFVNNSNSYRVALLNANTMEDINDLLIKIKSSFPLAKEIDFTTITPALAIHTGPEALGIAVYCFD